MENAKKLVELKNITKIYGNNTVVDDLNLYIQENEFLTLVGPSGCGKTTTLRMIGGFESPESGEIILDGVVINNLPPYFRPINTVFQRYALFPHLDVFGNIAFGLKNFSRIIADIKSNATRKYETQRKELESKLKNKSTTKEEKVEIHAQLKQIKRDIQTKIVEDKAALIEKKLADVELKYNSIIEKLDEQIDLEWNKDEEVKNAKIRIKEINDLISEAIASGTSKAKAEKKYEKELEKLNKVAVWTELYKLEAKRKEMLKDKALEIKSAKSLMLNKKQITEAVLHALELVKLEGYENRKVATLSGGQQQRVAIARAIVNKPRILLLDEPLAALDLKLRQSMQYELKEMQKKLGITFVFVTHDQEEALTMSDTIVVMNKGIIQQIGSPKEIYDEPKNRFVASFIGDSNIIRTTYLGNGEFNLLGGVLSCSDGSEKKFKKGDLVDVVIRPEDFDIVDLKDAKITGIVENVIFKGIHFEITVMVGETKLILRKYEILKEGDTIGLSVDPFEIHLMRVTDEEI